MKLLFLAFLCSVGCDSAIPHRLQGCNIQTFECNYYGMLTNADVCKSVADVLNETMPHDSLVRYVCR